MKLKHANKTCAMDNSQGARHTYIIQFDKQNNKGTTSKSAKGGHETGMVGNPERIIRNFTDGFVSNKTVHNNKSAWSFKILAQTSTNKNCVLGN